LHTVELRRAATTRIVRRKEIWEAAVRRRCGSGLVARSGARAAL